MGPDRQVIIILTSRGHIIIPTITSPQNKYMVPVANEMAGEAIYPDFFIASAGEENTLK